MPLPNNVDIYDNIGEINVKNLKNFVKTKEKVNINLIFLN